MHTNSQIEKLKIQVVKNLVKGTVKELKQIKKSEDLTSQKAYNLIQMMFSLSIASGKTPLTTKEELTAIVNDCYNDFLEQANFTE